MPINPVKVSVLHVMCLRDGRKHAHEPGEGQCVTCSVSERWEEACP